jgi:acyltransferase
LKSKVRLEWVDVLRGILMFLVIYGHYTSVPSIEKYIYSFHMPAFFLISGMMLAFNKEWRPARFVWKRVKSLLLPYLLLNLYVVPIWWVNVCNGTADPEPFWHVFVGIAASNVRSGYSIAANTTWFIPCLFVTEMIFFAAKKLLRKDYLVAAVIPAVSAVMYFAVTSRHPGGGYWHAESAFTAVIFYLAGYLFLRHLDAVRHMLQRSMARNVLLIGLLYGTGLWFAERNGRVSLIGDYYKTLPYFYLAALSTSFALVLTMMLLSERKWFSRVFHLAKRVGVTTLPYMAFQVGVIRIIRHYIPFFREDIEWRILLLSVIFYAAFLPAAVFVQRFLLPGRRKGINPAERTRRAGGRPLARRPGLPYPGTRFRTGESGRGTGVSLGQTGIPHPR